MQPRVTVTTSWDDGHKLDLRMAALLDKYGVLGTFYVAPENREIDPALRLSDQDIRQIATKHEIGAHTLTHPKLPKLGHYDIDSEIRTSKDRLESILGRSITSFCYPNGAFNFKTQVSVQKHGFTYARTTRRFRYRAGNLFAAGTTVHAYSHWSDLWRIARFAHFNVRKILSYRDWSELAIAQFEDCRELGGQFHLWGHSWEIEKNGDWDRLERVLKYVAGSKNVQFVHNSQLPHSSKILVAAPYYAPEVGGLEGYAREMALGASNQGAEIVIVTTGKSRSIQVQEQDGSRIYRLPVQLTLSNTPMNIAWFAMVRKIIKRELPDVINVHTPVPFMADVAVTVAGHIPVIITYHSGSMKKRRFLLDQGIRVYEKLILPIILHRARHIICSSDWVRDNFLASYKHKSSTITPGVNMDLFRLREPRKPGRSILFIGDYHGTWKGLPVLREAIAKVDRAELVVVGSGQPVDWPRTKYVGILKGQDLVEAIHKSDIVVLPSIAQSESFGMVLLEAQACGVPVIGSDVGGIPQVIDAGATGLLVPPRDVDALSEAISNLLDHPHYANRLSRAGRANVEAAYRWEDRTRKYANLIASLTGRAVPSRASSPQKYQGSLAQKTSLVFTVLNEQDTILRLLNSIERLSTLPDEVVIVDGGSTDATISLIRSWIHRTNSFVVRLISGPGTNISEGRNLAVAAAKHDIVVVTDGGCELKHDWLRIITEPIRQGRAQLVYGGTVARGQSLVGVLFAHFYYSKTQHDHATNTDHSSRSVAFMKSLWAAVGGYPEWLTLAGEDTLFFIEMDKVTSAVDAREAIVYWYHGEESLARVYRVHRRNSIGSGEAAMWLRRNLILIGIYACGYAVIVLALATRNYYLLGSTILLFGLCWSRQTLPVFRATGDPRALVGMPVIMAVRDVGMVNGYLRGLRRRMGGER